MWALTTTEFAKLQKRLMTRILSLLAVVFGLGYPILMIAMIVASDRYGNSKPTDAQAMETMKDMLLFPGSIAGTFQLLQQPMTIFACIFVGATVASEFSWGTVRTVVINARGRTHFLLAKILNLLGFSLGWIIVGAVLGLLATIALTPLAGRSLQASDFTLHNAGIFLLMIGKLELAVLPYAAVAFLLAILGRSPIAGIGGGLAFYLVESYAVTGLSLLGSMKEVLKFTVSRNAGSVLREASVMHGGGMNELLVQSGLGALVPAYLNQAVSALLLAAYTAILLGIALYVFHKRDITVGH